MLKILLTSTSFMDTPGKHQDLLNKQGFDVTKLRGPLKEQQLLEVIDQFDAIICGDDEYTKEVLTKGKASKLKMISKYGVGLDSFDLPAAKSLDILVTNCPGVNQIAVAEHVFGLLLSYCRKIPTSIGFTKQGQWKRLTGNQIYGKQMLILGLGAVGKEVAIRSKAFGLNVSYYDIVSNADFESKWGLEYFNDLDKALKNADIISVHLPLNSATTNLISAERINNKVKSGAIIVNTSRAKILDQEALLLALKNGKLEAYLTDVMPEEPMNPESPLKDLDNVLITPHIGSRTFESVEMQGLMAVENLLNYFKNAN